MGSRSGMARIVYRMKATLAKQNKPTCHALNAPLDFNKPEAQASTRDDPAIGQLPE
ncbi:MAG: hypothetical protein KJ070_09970 [Verrucomicrobia bacterium]|nr:hypothetical protein [Verrucomicrobiota bacterium]